MRNQAPAGPSISAPLATATVAPTAGASAIAAAADLPGPPPLRRSKRLVISKVMADFIGQPNLEYRECVRFVKDYIEQKDLSSPQNRTLFARPGVGEVLRRRHLQDHVCAEGGSTVFQLLNGQAE